MTVKDPQLMKSSLRVLNGKAQLYPNDITVIHQALIDISDNRIDLNAKSPSSLSAWPPSRPAL